MYDRLKDKYSLPWRFKKSWIEALRSGYYTQGTGLLRQTDSDADPSYCCLGVACSVAGVQESEIEGEWVDSFFDKYQPVPEVLHGEADSNELVEALSSMNDNDEQFTFNDIADWINDNIKATK